MWSDSVCSRLKQCRLLTDERLPLVFSSAANQARKVADEDVMVCVRFVISQQQQVDEVFPLSVRRDVNRNGLTFVESHHVDGNVFIQMFKLGDVFGG